jgi:hypothetical protein
MTASAKTFGARIRHPMVDSSAGELGPGRPAIGGRDDAVGLPVELDGWRSDDGQRREFAYSRVPVQGDADRGGSPRQRSPDCRMKRRFAERSNRRSARLGRSLRCFERGLPGRSASAPRLRIAFRPRRQLPLYLTVGAQQPRTRCRRRTGFSITASAPFPIVISDLGWY